VKEQNPVKDQASILMTRIFDAPRERVFEAWTRAEHLGVWYAPKGFTITDCAADPRPGGVFRMRWRAPWGDTYSVLGEYREVFAPRRVVIACTLEDDQRASRLEEIIEVDFEQSGSRTKLRLNSTARGRGAQAPRMLAGLDKGWAQTVDRLGVLLDPATLQQKSPQEKTQKEM
jgi:uncharacterized protein YndB with AHSA1/START domain